MTRDPRGIALEVALGIALALAALVPDRAAAAPLPPALQRQAIDPTTAVDHDGMPIAPPAKRDPPLLGNLLREAVLEPIGGCFDVPDLILRALGGLGVDRYPPASNINHRDEVPNSTWFTNRNHVRAVPVAEVRAGAFGAIHPKPPYVIKSVKRQGFNPGFNIEDAAGKRWVVKLDAVGYPQISSGAGVVSSRLLYAAGYNVPHDEAFALRRRELTLDPDVAKGKDGDPPFTESDLDALLERGAKLEDGRLSASASLYLPGTIVGPFSFRGRRPDDPNDRLTHANRRELRGLFVLYSWINNWDVKDQQSLDTFMKAGSDTTGHLVHYLLDLNGSLGASAEGPKDIRYGYEQRLDMGWIARRLVTLGFVVEPWRRAPQVTGIPSVGNFGAEGFAPNQWRPLMYLEPLRKMTMGDAYWGAKIVASFSDRQIAAAIDAAGYADPRARDVLNRVLRERRDTIARFWFGRVAPLDFFEVRDGELWFRDLAVDLGLEAPRRYECAADGLTGTQFEPELPGSAQRLSLERWAGKDGHVSLRLSVSGSRARAVRVELERRGTDWVITRVRHG